MRSFPRSANSTHCIPSLQLLVRQAAMSEWERYPEAEAQILRVEYQDEDHAVVIIDTVPSHPMRNNFTRTADGWTWTHDG